MSSADFMEWDALSVFLESVMSRLVNAERPKPPVSEGISLLKAVLAYNTQVCVCTRQAYSEYSICCARLNSGQL